MSFDRDAASRLFLKLLSSATEVRKGFEAAEKHIHERHMRDARSSLSSSASVLRAFSADLDDLRKVLGLEDPKIIQKNELRDRARTTVSSLNSAVARRKWMVDSGETDQGILAAVDQVIARYESALSSAAREMSDAGWTQPEILAACDRSVEQKDG